MIEDVLYRKEKYACHLWIKKERCAHRDWLQIQKTMTRWIARLVRDEPIVTGGAHAEVSEDLLTGQLALRAWAYAFGNVDPGDRETLAFWVDTTGVDSVQIPRLPKNGTMQRRKNAPESGESGW